MMCGGEATYEDRLDGNFSGVDRKSRRPCLNLVVERAKHDLAKCAVPKLLPESEHVYVEEVGNSGVGGQGSRGGSSGRRIRGGGGGHGSVGVVPGCVSLGLPATVPGGGLVEGVDILVAAVELVESSHEPLEHEWLESRLHEIGL